MKYEIIKNSSLVTKSGVSVYRIRALKTFITDVCLGDGSVLDVTVNKGDVGGYVGGLDNLSQSGNCWIFDDAKVYRNVLVADNATVHGDSVVSSGATSGNVKISGQATFINCRIVANAAIHGEDYPLFVDCNFFGKSDIHIHKGIIRESSFSHATMLITERADISKSYIKNSKIKASKYSSKEEEVADYIFDGEEVSNITKKPSELEVLISSLTLRASEKVLVDLNF